MIIRFLQNWFLATFVTTGLIGVVASWNSTTLTLPLDIGAGAAFVIAAFMAGRSAK